MYCYDGKFTPKGQVGIMVGFTRNMKDSYEVMEMSEPYTVRSRGFVEVIENIDVLSPIKNVTDGKEAAWYAFSQEFEADIRKDPNAVGYLSLFKSTSTGRVCSAEMKLTTM